MTTMKWCLDVGITLRGGFKEWTAINEALDKLVPVQDVSAGTGFGCRDRQWEFETEAEARAYAFAVRRHFGKRCEYAGVYPLEEES